MQTASTKNSPSYLQNWRSSFWVALAGCLLVWSCLATAQEPDTPAQRPVEFGGKHAAEPMKDPASVLPMLAAPKQEEAPRPMPLPMPPLPSSNALPPVPAQPPEPAAEVPAAPRKLPLPTPSPFMPEPVEPAPLPAPAPAQAPDSEPEQVANTPAGSTWTMLITPGASVRVAPRAVATLTTFELDDETGEVIGEPDEQLLGPAAAIAALQHNGNANTAGHPEHSALSAYNTAGGPALAQAYREIYDAIPYSRAEYLANPAYRHETTIELLFGQMRPTTVHKHDTPRRIYNLPQWDEGPPRAPGLIPGAVPLSWYSPMFPAPSYPGYFTGYNVPFGWPLNSTYRKYPTYYGPLFNRHYRPLGIR